jgi:hypothetical protein
MTSEIHQKQHLMTGQYATFYCLTAGKLQSTTVRLLPHLCYITGGECKTIGPWMKTV